MVRRQPIRRAFSALLAGGAWSILITLAAGCSGQTAEQALDKALKRAGQTRQTVFPLGGQVLIDGTRPTFDLQHPLVVTLFESDKLDAPPQRRHFIECDEQGRFAFSTYKRHDGVPPGRYVLVFARLSRGLAPRSFTGPDELHNLYNDPVKNAQDPRFQLDHRRPGKTDYAFDLTVAGIQRPASMPPKAVTSLPK
jgi:hypothetical protein